MQAVSTRRNAEPPTRYGSFHGQYGALYSIPFAYFSSQVLVAPVVASVARDAHADALLVERDFSPSGVQIADFPKQSRPSAAALASASLVSTLDSAAALARAHAALNAVSPVPQAALTMLRLLAPQCHRTRRFRFHLSRLFCLIFLESPATKLPRAELPRAGPRVIKLSRLADPPGDPDDDPEKNERDREIDLKRKN